MKTAYSVVSENNFRTIFLMTVFLSLVFGLGYVFSYLLKDRTIFYGFVIFGVLTNIIAIFWGDKIVLSLSGAKEVKKENFPELWNLVDNLSIAAGLPKIPKIYIINSPALNAFATGKSPKNSYVVFTKGILEKLDKSELEGVAAHEISHIKNYDIRVMMIASILAGIIAIMADMFLHSVFSGGRDRDKNNGLLFIIGLVLSFLAPIFAQLITLAISRKREFMADATAALLTRHPEALASALEKISSSNIPLDASPATAHLFISNPFKNKGSIRNWLGNLFSTHPPVEERIKVLRNMVF